MAVALALAIIERFHPVVHPPELIRHNRTTTATITAMALPPVTWMTVVNPAGTYMLVDGLVEFGTLMEPLARISLTLLYHHFSLTQCFPFSLTMIATACMNPVHGMKRPFGN
jgi:hypothetical protein